MIPLLLALVGCGEPAEKPVATSSTQAAPKRAEIPAKLGLGREASAEEVAAWDLDVDPTGRGLPAGQGTVAEGRDLYARQCVSCHGPKGEGGIGPKLIGAEPKTGFGEDPKLPRTIGNWWPYATTVYDYTRRAMPQHAPGSLSPDQVYALTAFLLAENGAVPQDFVADATSLPAVKMPTTVTFVQDDREGAAVVR